MKRELFTEDRITDIKPIEKSDIYNIENLYMKIQKIYMRGLVPCSILILILFFMR